MRSDWVRESAFGVWFVNTNIWIIHVLRTALNDLEPLMEPRRDRYPVILDVGCGHGHSFRFLDRRFRPDKIIGLDIDPRVSEWCANKAKSCACDIELLVNNAASMDIPDASVDMVFCHQTFHHFVDQEGAARELFRVLKPGGVLLFAESCRKYIHSLLIKVFFRHPMDVQKTDTEYLQLLKDHGFQVKSEAVSRPYLWWSRSDFGLLEKFCKKVPKDKEETMVNLVAYRPE